jgi:hypothetical protein
MNITKQLSTNGTDGKALTLPLRQDAAKSNTLLAGAPALCYP